MGCGLTEREEPLKPGGVGGDAEKVGGWLGGWGLRYTAENFQRILTMSHSHSDNPNEPTDGPDTASQTIGSIFFAAFTLAVIVGFSVWMYIRLGWNLL
jgi:hypothetical protein